MIHCVRVYEDLAPSARLQDCHSGGMKMLS